MNEMKHFCFILRQLHSASFLPVMMNFFLFHSLLHSFHRIISFFCGIDFIPLWHWFYSSMALISFPKLGKWLHNLWEQNISALFGNPTFISLCIWASNEKILPYGPAHHHRRSQPISSINSILFPDLDMPKNIETNARKEWNNNSMARMKQRMK